MKTSKKLVDDFKVASSSFLEYETWTLAKCPPKLVQIVLVTEGTKTTLSTQMEMRCFNLVISFSLQYIPIKFCTKVDVS